ncbi:sensor histidine kinase [Hydrogenimonas urashimensis]|uniref:sensor histidine kinase n=1 Tax=Hydrogenimonas urashimensis TaxID=2740515 RepID=UPI00191647BD|nr:HAMP domain-containing sensor histidine kinase [Hydrogenimonas urashimensis]
MALNPDERRSLFRFMSVYLGAGLVIVVTFSFLFYRIDSESIRDRTLSGLRMTAMTISASAVAAQMQGKPFKIPETSCCEYLLLDGSKKPIVGSLSEPFDLKREFYVQNGCAHYIDRSAHGHMNIEYIVLRDCTYGEKIRNCALRVIVMGLAAYLFLVLVGWYLGRLFLKPMREKIEAMDRFIKDSTHELNTPVTTMLLALQKIESKECKPVYLKALQMSGRLIARVYEDLTFMLLQDKRVKKDHLRNVDVANVVKESVEFFSILAERKSIDVELQTETCYVEADPHHLALLVKNLLDNALKYTRSGGRVEIRLEACRLRVSDSGSGIPHDKLQDIFRRFHRENRVEGGFGIGLSIVESICRMYGYHIDVVSEVGRGSTFTVQFARVS